MEKDYSLYKSRSVRGIITTAFGRLSASFRQVFRLTWPVALVFCIFWMMLSLVPLISAPAWTIPLILVLGGIVELYFYCVVVKFLSGHPRPAFPDGLRMLGRWIVTVLTNWRQYGLTLAVLLLASLFILLAMCIIILPQIIMVMATFSSNYGVMHGDPSGLPNGFIWLAAVTSFLGGLLRIYIALTMVYCAWYLYGSIVVRRNHN